jgi:hypothetical protein
MGGQCGPNGTSCTSNSQCGSGYCIVGICCAANCTDQGVSTCGTDGKCESDGSKCKFYSGKACGNPSCFGSTLTPAPTCNGDGACVPSASGACPANFACANGTSCKTVCSAPSDCKNINYTCGTIGVTMGQCLLKSGQPCSADDQCASDGCGGTCL